MHLFYTPDIVDSHELYTLSESESKHAIKVLRLKTDDHIQLVDGKGNFYDGIITNDHVKKCETRIIKTTKEETDKPHLHIAIAPTKNNDRMEWFIEKCTEIGVNEITPVVCDHSERKKIKQERLEKTAVSAMKQSLKATLPQINELSPLKQILDKPFDGEKFIAHCYKENQKHLQTSYKVGTNALILIGPEGDFSQEEIKLALNSGFQAITLGSSRLRTETAGIYACTTFNLLNE